MAPRRTPSGRSTPTAGMDAAVAAGHLGRRHGARRRGRRARAARPPRRCVRGLGAAPGSGSGPVRVITALADASRLVDGDVLVTHMTSPDWVPLMRRAAAIVTDSGGMTCHAAIVSRELGVPCVVGTAEATHKLRDGELVTVDATHGVVFHGAVRRGGHAANGRGGPRHGAAGERDQAAGQPVRALPGGASRGAQCRWRRPAASRADGDRGARRRPSEAADRAGPLGGVHRSDGLRL